VSLNFQLDPPKSHYTGDLWAQVSFGGLDLGALVGGIVITPACDLANRKADTLTFLPVIPISSYLGRVCGLRLLSAHLRGLLSEIEIGVWNAAELTPSIEWYEMAESALQRQRSAPNLKQKRLALLDQIDAGIQSLRLIDQERQAPTPLLRRTYGKAWPELLADIVHNRPSKPDTYFISPRHEQTAILSEPSVALLRYPMSISVAVFDAAADPSLRDWNSAVERLSARIPGIVGFRDVRPTKLGRVGKVVMADLLSKFASLFIRVGVPTLPNLQANMYIACYEG
jgi:hypothetical protein